MLKIKEGYFIHGVQLSLDDLVEVSIFYRKAELQNVIYNTYEVTERQAWELAKYAYCEELELEDISHEALSIERAFQNQNLPMTRRHARQEAERE